MPCAWGFARFAPLERFTLGLAASVILVAAFSFLAYLLHLDPRWHWLLVLLAAAGGIVSCAPTRDWLRSAEILSAVTTSWLLFACWCLGLLACIFSYSGGRWAGDWLEHYGGRVFPATLAVEHSFINLYPLTAATPLGNLATGAFLALTDENMVTFQIFTALLNTLVFFPVTLFARRWGASPNSSRGGPGAHAQSDDRTKRDLRLDQAARGFFRSHRNILPGP